MFPFFSPEIFSDLWKLDSVTVPCLKFSRIFPKPEAERVCNLRSCHLRLTLGSAPLCSLILVYVYHNTDGWILLVRRKLPFMRWQSLESPQKFNPCCDPVSLSTDVYIYACPLLYICMVWVFCAAQLKRLNRFFSNWLLLWAFVFPTKVWVSQKRENCFSSLCKQTFSIC